MLDKDRGSVPVLSGIVRCRREQAATGTFFGAYLFFVLLISSSLKLAIGTIILSFFDMAAALSVSFL